MLKIVLLISYKLTTVNNNASELHTAKVEKKSETYQTTGPNRLDFIERSFADQK